MVSSNFKPLQANQAYLPLINSFSEKRFISILPEVNIVEKATSYEIYLAAPGLQKDDFKIVIEKDILKISAFKNESSEKAEHEKFIMREFSYSRFEKTFKLNDDILTDEIQATYEQGILKVVLQKSAVVQAKKINIQ